MLVTLRRNTLGIPWLGRWMNLSILNENFIPIYMYEKEQE